MVNAAGDGDDAIWNVEFGGNLVAGITAQRHDTLSAALMLPGLVQAQGMYIAPKFLMSIQDTGRVVK